MIRTTDELTQAIIGRGLPDTVARIAVYGGESGHPALVDRAQPVDITAGGETQAVMAAH